MSATVHNITDGRQGPRKPTAIDWAEPFITKDQLAQHLGFSTRWVELRLKEGLPHYRVGGRVRFQRSQAMKWLIERGT